MILNIKKKKIKIYKFHIFVLTIIIIKIILMGLFSSDYQNKMFVPFISKFVETGGNPYSYFYELDKYNMFPYPTAMLFIESIAGRLVDILGVTSVFICNIIYKFPSLIFDILGLYFLVELFPSRRRYAAVFYFASPIILYAVYMHGQLDLIPTVLLLGAIYYLSSNMTYRYLKGALLLSVALLSKMHTIAVLPIIFIYLYKRDGIKKTLLFSIGVVMATIMGMLPFMSKAFCEIVLFNAEQNILTQVSLKFVSVEMYIPIIVVLIVYLMTFSINIINRDLFLSLCSVVFAVFLVLCPPMPGWYVWIVPYITLFFINIDEGKYKNIIIFVLVNTFYLLYFIFAHNRNFVDLYFLNLDLSFLKINNNIFSNMLFTLLAGTLIYIIISVYHLGINSNSLYKRRNLPFTIGIAGDSGTGKSTLIDIIESSLGHDNLLYIEGDGDHKWERGEKYWSEYTHLNPKANYLYRQASDLRQLRSGIPVKRVEYDHNTGKFTKEKKIKPKRYILLCGLHSLYLPQTRNNFDLKIYMDVDETLRRYWKIQRDIANRGYSNKMIIKQIEDRIPDAKKYIYPQKKYANMIIQYYDKTLSDCTLIDHKVRVSLRITVSAAINIEILIDELIKYGIMVNYDYSEDLQMQMIDIDADDLENAVVPIDTIANKIVPQLDEITREKLNKHNGKDAIIKLFLLLLISNKLRGEI